MSKQEPTFVGAWLIAGGVAVLFIAPLFLMVSVIAIGAGLVVLGHELEPTPGPWPNGSVVSKTLVLLGAGLILCAVLRLFSPLWSG